MDKKAICIANIKSKVNIQKIFSFLKKRRKLEIVYLSKKIRNKLLINIEDYKLESKKYKVGPKNGYGKEFKLNTDILIFEGEYLEGKKNGIGKEYYDNGKIKFEGEYLSKSPLKE